MSMALAKRIDADASQGPRELAPVPTFEQLQQLAAAVARSGLFAVKTPDQALTLMMLCQAEGLHPMQALRQYHLIDGRPTMRADAIQARFQQRGGVVKWLTRTDEEVEAEFSHPQGGTLRVKWSMEMARKAKLASKNNWQQYPRQMLTARVVSEGVRTVLPDVVVGLYTPEEAADFGPMPVAPKDGPGEGVYVTPPNLIADPAIGTGAFLGNPPFSAPAPPPAPEPADPALSEARAAEWGEHAEARGYDAQVAIVYLHDKLKELGAELSAINPKHWANMLGKMDKGGYDAGMVLVEAKAVADYDVFMGSVLAAVFAQGVDMAERGDVVAYVNLHAKTLYGDKADGRKLKLPERVRLLTAIRDGSFDFATGKIGQVEAALAAGE